MFFQENGCTKHEGGFHQTQMHIRGCARRRVCTENFFLGSYFTRQLLLW